MQKINHLGGLCLSEPELRLLQRVGLGAEQTLAACAGRGCETRRVGQLVQEGGRQYRLCSSRLNRDQMSMYLRRVRF